MENKYKDINEWLNSDNVDKQLKDELNEMDDAKKSFAFENELIFGTAGIRGLLGPGPGNFNIFTIRSVTRAYAMFLREKSSVENKKVVIGHDNRKFSREFALEAAKILSSYDIDAYIFSNNDMRPTPVVSFLTTKLGCNGGIVITASHNPKEYNGYKIYDEFGCQLTDGDTKIIASHMEKQDNILDWVYISKDSKIIEVNKEQEDLYDDMIRSLQFFKNEKKDLTVIYSAVNGTGSNYLPRLLKESNFNVIIVEEHGFEDETFKNVGNPNPEFEPAWKIPFEYAVKHPEADIIIMTDPDADRLGVAVKHKGEWIRLNGNETGPLLIDWKLSNLVKNNTMPKNPAMYSSFVTSDLGDRIANEKYGVKVIKTLTGFKWMASEILKEPKRELNFVFAYEESFGYVIDPSTKDKDGIQAAITFCEAAWWYKKNKKKTMIDYLTDIYTEFGCYYTHTFNLNFSVSEIKEKIQPIMAKLREEPFDEIGSVKLKFSEDYINGLYNMPGQNLIKFYFEDKSWFAVRPSGTEPKVKIYFVCVDKTTKDAKNKLDLFASDLSKYLGVNLK